MSTDGQPWVSVVIPTYQGERFLHHALDSIARQGSDDIEVIVVDDGSTDNTRQIIEQWADRLPIQSVWKNHSGNWVANTNAGLSLAKGEWICLLHQDDAWHPSRIHRLREAAGQHPEAKMFLHPARFIDEENRPVGYWQCPLPPNEALAPEFVLPRLLVQNFIPIVSPLFHRSIMEQVGAMDEALWYFADWDYWLKLSAVGRVVYINEPLADFRIHPASQTARRTADVADVGRQFDTVTGRVIGHPQFPSERLPQARRMIRFSRAVYLYMLASLHGGVRSLGALLLEVLRAGPVTWIRYIRFSRLFDRLLPRLRVNRIRRSS